MTATDTSDPSGKTESYNGSFIVAPTNRSFTLPRVKNTRDISTKEQIGSIREIYLEK